ncbi:MAG TPA: GvpL/GvpF family gas vesicle protein [Rhodopila sp.]|uniref:GvpL/GvpF family gas vesicle protein n=1 Tax=Rhodopila sp. TaxID=2480087 RepID=UPI002C56388C|nr:GvpL/GvpF family gas vesicle protein [Rhodopila sp.]HVY17981.1 GvpL/GvpF family gas vesicle protein [Rhodopila sp.]
MTTDRILGYAPLEGLDGLLTRLNAVPGPPVEAWHGCRLAAVLQSEPQDLLFCRQSLANSADFLAVERRLELACHAGPFLPQDPSAAIVPSDAVPALFAPAWLALHTALSTHGQQRQWDIHLRWSPRAAVNHASPHLMQASGRSERVAGIRAALRTERARQEARLLNTLSRAVLAFATDPARGTGTGIRVTALIRTGAEAAMEAALEALEEPDLAIELHGPLPPLTFAPVRIATTATAEIAAAWAALELDDRIGRDGLRMQWNTRVASLRPDRQRHRLSGAAPGMAGLTDAYRMLHALLPPDGTEASYAEALAQAGRRLIVPDAPPGITSSPQRVQLELAQ